MATTEQIDTAAKTDEELHRRPATGVEEAALHILAGADVPLDAATVRRASRWLRRHQPKGWRELLDAIDAPKGGPLTKWSDNPDVAAACLAEALADESVRIVADPAPEPQMDVVPAETPKQPRRRPDWTWQNFAACRDLHFLFFGPDGERQAQKEAREEQAKRVCAGCPVRLRCLESAFVMKLDAGVWGGLGEEERASKRRSWVRRGSQRGVTAA